MANDHSHRDVNPVEAQVKAYNAHDLDGFLACYSRDIVIRDGDGSVVVRGIEDMKMQFADLFQASPALHAEILTRIDVGAYAVLEERIEGYGGEPLRGVMVYHRTGDTIDRAVWLT
jgi:hypothetical protein